MVPCKAAKIYVVNCYMVAQLQPNYPVYVATYDYNSSVDDDLSFKKGDLMYIISTEYEDWWFAQLKDKGKEGYIPSNFVTEWKSLEAEE